MVNLSDEEMIEKARVKELVEFERYCRDYADYGTEEAEWNLWFDDARIVTTWHDGGKDTFMRTPGSFTYPKTKTPDEEGVIDSFHHRANNTLVWLKGTRAIAEYLCCMVSRRKVNGEWMDTQVMARMHYRAEKREGKWGLVFMDVIYEQDRMDPVFQDAAFTMPREVVKKHRNINWNMSGAGDYAKPGTGRKHRDEALLYGYDLPEQVNELYAESTRWLKGEEV